MYTLLKMGSYNSTTMCHYWDNLLRSILILLTCPNSDTLVCYNNDPFLTCTDSFPCTTGLQLQFEQSSYTFSENAGLVEVCASTLLPPGIQLETSISFEVGYLNNTAVFGGEL